MAVQLTIINLQKPFFLHYEQFIIMTLLVVLSSFQTSNLTLHFPREKNSL